MEQPTKKRMIFGGACFEEALKVATIYTVSEVAEILKLPESTVYEYIRKNLLPHFKVGKHIRIREDDLKKWIESLMI